MEWCVAAPGPGKQGPVPAEQGFALHRMRDVRGGELHRREWCADLDPPPAPPFQGGG